MVNPQALIPNKITLGDAMMAAIKARDVVFQPPKIIAEDGELFAAENRTSIKFVQNCDMNAIKYKIGSDITGDDDFHGIIAGGSAQDDGLGSVVDLSHIQQAIYIKAVTGTPRLATILGFFNA